MFNLGNMRKTKYPVVGHKELVEERVGLQNHQVSSSYKMRVVWRLPFPSAKLSLSLRAWIQAIREAELSRIGAKVLRLTQEPVLAMSVSSAESRGYAQLVGREHRS
jgi:hypothetical protein